MAAPGLKFDGSLENPAYATGFSTAFSCKTILKGDAWYIGQLFYKQLGATRIKLQAHGDPSSISLPNIRAREPDWSVSFAS
jgi:hypothetical protein